MSLTYAEARRIGDEGEELAESVLLPKLFPGAHITRIGSDDQPWLYADFLVVDGERRYFVDVKYDRHDTGNIAVETRLVYVSGREVPGWLYRSKSDYILYILKAFQEAYLIPLPELRMMVKKGYRESSTLLKGVYRAYFYLVPKLMLEHANFRRIEYGDSRQTLAENHKTVQMADWLGSQPSQRGLNAG